MRRQMKCFAISEADYAKACSKRFEYPWNHRVSYVHQSNNTVTWSIEVVSPLCFLLGVAGNVCSLQVTCLEAGGGIVLDRKHRHRKVGRYSSSFQNSLYVAV